MSQLGDLVRLPARLRAEIVADRRTAYDRMTGEFDVPKRLALDWEWRPFRDLMELAGWRVNPFTGGSPFPGDDEHWDDAYTLDPAQVADVAARLRDTPFGTFAPHLRTVFGEGAMLTLDGDPTSPTYLRELPPERWEPRRLSDDWIRDRHEQLAARYAELVEFYRAAAAGGECTVFWAA